MKKISGKLTKMKYNFEDLEKQVIQMINELSDCMLDLNNRANETAVTIPENTEIYAVDLTNFPKVHPGAKIMGSFPTSQANNCFTVNGRPNKEHSFTTKFVSSSDGSNPVAINSSFESVMNEDFLLGLPLKITTKMNYDFANNTHPSIVEFSWNLHSGIGFTITPEGDKISPFCNNYNYLTENPKILSDMVKMLKCHIAPLKKLGLIAAQQKSKGLEVGKQAVTL
ncbi:MAG: hypothetical protein LBM38_04295 [Clostridiales bacterium]|jgi:hypothetical protein|nr:hypothetical protein [Clostridiales bacterium]